MNDQNTIRKLVSENQGYVHALARHYLKWGVDLDDLVSEGNLGMIQAAQAFNPALGRRFVNFAAPFIRSSIEKALKNYGVKAPMSIDEPIPVGSRNTISLLHVLEDKNSPRADEHLWADADTEEVEKLLKVLDEREQTVIRGLYGIGEDRLTMAELGEKNGWKRERVRQIRDKALKKLGRASTLLPLL